MRVSLCLALVACLASSAEDAKQNAAKAYREAFDAIAYPEDSSIESELKSVVKEGWHEDHQALSKVLQQNEVALGKLRTIGDWSRCEFLEGATLTEWMELPHMAAAKKTARIAALRGRLEASQGHIAEGAAWDLACIRMAIGLGNDRALMPRLVETAMLRMAGWGLADVVRSPDCDAATLKEIAGALDAILARRVSTADTFDCERGLLLDAADVAFLDGPEAKDPSVVPGDLRMFVEAVQTRHADRETRTRWRDQYRVLVQGDMERIKRGALAGRLDEVNSIEKEVCLQAADLQKGNPPEVLVELLLPAYEVALKALARGEATIQALRVLTAIRRYREDEKKLPYCLDLLVPKYLPAVPRDPFDGQPLRYDTDGVACRTWSIGPDLKDDGGWKQYDEDKEEPGTDMIWELK